MGSIIKALGDKVHGLVRLILVRLDRRLGGDERLVLGFVRESILEEHRESRVFKNWSRKFESIPESICMINTNTMRSCHNA